MENSQAYILDDKDRHAQCVPIRNELAVFLKIARRDSGTGLAPFHGEKGTEECSGNVEETSTASGEGGILYVKAKVNVTDDRQN